MPTKSTRSAPKPTDLPKVARTQACASPRVVKPPSKRSAAQIRVQFASRSRLIPAAAHFRAWVRSAAKLTTGITKAKRAPNAAVLSGVTDATDATGVIDVTIRVVTETEAHRLNRDFRGRDYATNVLTFAYAPGRGDIVLCAQVLARESRAQGKTLESHYAHLTIHAMLHLLGHDHARPAETARMESIEIRILKRLGYQNPYAD